MTKNTPAEQHESIESCINYCQHINQQAIDKSRFHHEKLYCLSNMHERFLFNESEYYTQYDMNDRKKNRAKYMWMIIEIDLLVVN